MRNISREMYAERQSEVNAHSGGVEKKGLVKCGGAGDEYLEENK